MQRRLYGYRTLDVPVGVAVERLEQVVDDPTASAQTVFVRALGIPLRRDVDVSFGELVASGGGASVPLSFRDAHRPEWFPIFDGAIDVMGVDLGDDVTQLTVVGSYSPPFGAIGQVGDTFVLGRRVGEATVVALLDALASLLTPASRVG